VLLDDRFVGSRYGVSTSEMVDAVRFVGRTEGLLLDPVYTGKAMAGLLAQAREGQLHGDVVFLHCGGSTALFGYRSNLSRCWGPRPGWFGLPGAVPAGWSVEGVVEGGGL
jgi:1-aminocyclopropane-1-carboxylate deaminase/D-cysteine desulfhydrase-like pyridoxal-dependent ACC family enzyme